MDFEVSHVRPEDINAVWGHVAPMIERGLQHGSGDSLTSDYIRQAVISGHYTLWVVHQDHEIIAAVIFEVAVHPNKKTLMVIMAAGRDFHRWVDQVSGLLRDLAGIIGVDTIEANARKGMAKWLQQAGWKPKSTIMELPYGR